MKLNPISSHRSNFALRLFAFFPVLLVTLPALAESFALPTCPFQDVLQDQKSLLLDCSQPDPDAAASQPATAPSTQPPVASDRGQPTPSAPGAGNTAQNPDNSAPATTPAPQPPETTLPPPPPLTKLPPAIMVELDVFGNTVFTPTELQEFLNPSKGKPATRQEACRVANQLTKAYRDRGYILAQTFPLIDRTTEALISKGIVRFLSVEGCLEKIEIVGSQRLRLSYINDRLAPGAATPFNANKINDLLSLVQSDPKIGKLEVLGITPGKSFGSSALSLRVTEGNFFTGFVGADSYVAPIFGGTRAIGGLTYRNATGNGDDLNATYFRSTTGEVDGLDFSYQLPLNSMNGQIQLRYAPTNVKISLQPNDQKFTSSSSTAEINYRQPLVRTSQNEFALSLGLSFQDEQTQLNGAPVNTNGAADSQGKTQTRVVKFAQEYSSSDDGGNWTLRSQFNLGIGALGATVNPKPALDGRFLVWQTQAQRVQRLSQDNYAIILAEAQLTGYRLIPNQQFTVGGGQSVRGYRQNVRSGDNGVRLSIEDRFIVGRNGNGQANLQLAANADIAQLWNNGGGAAVTDGLLGSVGAGIIWEPLPRLVTRLDYAVPLRSIVDRGSSFQDSGFNFSIGYGF
jgi:hemolysin activation/secretion protein